MNEAHNTLLLSYTGYQGTLLLSYTGYQGTLLLSNRCQRNCQGKLVRKQIGNNVKIRRAGV